MQSDNDTGKEQATLKSDGSLEKSLSESSRVAEETMLSNTAH